MKIITVVGARPQFIKAAVVSRALRQAHEEILVHTGQHYDKDMSDIFFKELHIPHPDYNLEVGSGSHASQTARIMTGIEQLLFTVNPDCVLIYGDTNSTLAAALAAVKVHIPVAHVEAGLRSFNMDMPEEINRILSDRISHWLFCPTETAVSNLKAEGMVTNVFHIGDVMCDAVLYYSAQIDMHEAAYFFDRLQPLFAYERPEKWYLATIHRAENTDDLQKLEEILAAFELLPHRVIFPVHPRTRTAAQDIIARKDYKNTILTHPVGYIDMLFFAKNAVKTITDSGGLQKETYILNTPCVTIRDQTEWVETLNGNLNVLVRPKRDEIVDKVIHTQADFTQHRDYYGDGHAAEKILQYLK